ncbi:anhydro-N-acetylmuramic acid kinase, partial [Chryseobacterium artocarpi]|uniref:anhydro-N-acetylmuramic acid kinase n=1 Tax=Chryseobacterium artocarpi TaxID=1414727 RepID=UPI003F2B55B9
MKTLAIGLMSGTSLDGLDICFAEFEKKEQWAFRIIKSETISYSTDWENKLRNSIHFSAPDLLALNSEYGFYLGK